MKVTIISRVLMGIALVALSATVAHAGGAGGGTLAQIFALECSGAHGADQGRFVILDGSQTVRVGSAAFVCSTTAVTVEVRPDDPLLNDVSSGTTLKCYNIAVLGKQAPQPPVDLADGFDTADTVQLFGPRYLCTFAAP